MTSPSKTDTAATAGTGPAAPIRHTILSIQAMRAVAAIAVVFYHTQLILAQPEYGHVVAGGWVTGLGWTGVNFFFVLSGFIIMYAHVGDIGRPARLGRYAWRRVVRIYPIYWACLTAYIAAALVGIGHPDFEKTVPHLLSAYTLLPFDPAPSLPIKVAWTLFYELGFYMLFGLLIVSRPIGLAAFAAWAAAILICGVALRWTGMGPLNAWNSYFLIGAALFLAWRRANPAWGLPLLAGGVLLFVAMALGGLVPLHVAEAQAQPVLLILLAAPFGLILLGGTLFERHRGWRPPAWAVLLGEGSYSIYLVHSPVLSVLAGLHRKLAFGMVPPLVLFFAAAVVATVAGVVTHLLVERPLLAALRGFGRARGIDAPPVRAGTA